MRRNYLKRMNLSTLMKIDVLLQRTVMTEDIIII